MATKHKILSLTALLLFSGSSLAMDAKHRVPTYQLWTDEDVAAWKSLQPLRKQINALEEQVALLEVMVELKYLHEVYENLRRELAYREAVAQETARNPGNPVAEPQDEDVEKFLNFKDNSLVE